MNSPKNTAYTLLRIAMGINIMCHGMVRLPKLSAFREWMISEFRGTLVPEVLVYLFGTVLPFFEFVIGLCILIGLYTYRAVTAGAILISVLILGSCLHEQWEWAGLQMIYALFFYFLISNVEHNAFSVDSLLKPKKAR